ncbi:coiled-coil domain-containing protein 183-like [Trachinotus anak]|uniref:coiled-coil domain-containing protein 183-like n=1 Tax=Trachinotus anak TaxID=443729 RepID=UPI0039F21AAD
MDFNSSSKMKDARTPAQSQTSEKQIEAQVLNSNDKCTPRRKPLSRLGHLLEKKLEQVKLRRYVLINEHNRLTLAVKGKEVKLKGLQESLKAMNLQPATYNNEDTLKQHMRQLENNREKMKMKNTEAKKIQVAYHHISENVQQEVRDMYQVLDQRECSVGFGQAKVDKATKLLQLAETAAGGTLGKMLQVEHDTMETRREIANELCELSAEVKWLKKQMEKFGRLSPRGQSRLRERETEKEEAHTVEDHQCYDTCDASGCDVKPDEDMEPLSEALGRANIQEPDKVVTKQATKEHLVTEIAQYDEVIGQEVKILAGLELQYADLKFSEKPAATRFDKLRKQIRAKINLEVNCVERLQPTLKESQDLLDTVEQGVDNLYFRMSAVEGFPGAKCTDRVDKLRDTSIPLQTLLQSVLMQKPEIRGLDQEGIYSLLEKFNTMEPGNNKKPATPTDTLQLSDDMEECTPTRDEIKRCSIRLIESQQSKKSSRRAKL